MKKLTLLSLSLAVFYSCAPTQFFQVHKTISENSTLVNDQIVFEDENCKVAYDLWGDHGDAGFFIFNKSETDLVIDLTKSFSVINSFAYPFYPPQNSGTDLQTFVVGQPERTIPPKAMIHFPDLRIRETRITQCDFIDHPSKKEIQVLKFDLTNSPIVFYNLITYYIAGELNRLETKFYVSEITNLPSPQMFEETYTDDCGKKLNVARKVYAQYSPDKFFIEYSFYR